MPRAKRNTVKHVELSEADLEWVREGQRQMELERPLWTTNADDFYAKHAGRWVAVRDGKVVHSSPDFDKFNAWLDKNDPERRKFLIHNVPAADAEFAF